MRHHRDAQLVTVCDGCHRQILPGESMATVRRGNRDHQSHGSDECKTKIQERFPLPYRTPQEVWDSEAKKADVGKVVKA